MASLTTKPNIGTDDTTLATLRENYFVWLILLVTAVVYAGTMRFEFVYDDTPQIVENPFIKAWHYLPQYFVSPVWKQMGPFAFGNYYRPMFLVLLRAAYALFGPHPLGWHVLAIAMHVAVTWLVYVLVRKMTGEFTIAWLTALIFGVHPIHHEVIAWVSGITESEYAIFFLLAFLAYMQSRQGARTLWLLLSCASFAVALFSKETAIVLPALVFAHGWIEYDPVEGGTSRGHAARIRSALLPATVYIPVALGYLLLRYRALSGLTHAISPIRPISWLLTLPSILLFYVRNWFFPFRLSEFYDLFYQPNLGFVHVIIPAMILMGLAAAVWIFRNRLGTKEVANAAAWVVIPLIPALDTFAFNADEVVHDRYFYVPSIGAAMLVALLIVRVFQSRLKIFGQPAHVIAAAASLTAVLALLTGLTANIWRSDYALFSWAHQVAPRNAPALNDLAGELLAQNDVAGAQKLLEAGYRDFPKDYHFALNLGRLYYNRRQYPQAQALFLQVEALNPALSDPYVLMGQIDLKQGRPKQAQEKMRQAVHLNPYSWSAHTIYGVVLVENGDCADADQEFAAALDLNPTDALTRAQLARCLAKQSQGAPPVSKPGEL